MTDSGPLKRAATIAKETLPFSPGMATQGIGVRPRTGSDTPFLRALYRDLRVPELAQVGWSQASIHAFLNTQFDLQHAHYLARYPHADFWIVSQTPSPGRSNDIGRLYLDRTSDRWHLIEIGLLRTSCGNGRGQALLLLIQQAAVAGFAEAIDLSVARDNLRAEAFYKRLGFRQRGESDQSHLAMTWTVS